MNFKTLNLQERNIRYSVSGHGRAVFLLHGFLANATLFDRLQTELALTYRVIAIDLPGHGASKNWAYVHSMELMAECIHEVARLLSIRRYVLVGHSMGGYVAVAYFQKYPQRVVGLFLLNSTTKADTENRKQDRLRALDLLQANKSVYSHETLKSLFAPNWPEQHPELYQRVVIAALEMSNGSIAAALRGMKDRSSGWEWIQRSGLPIAYGIGNYDTVLSAESLREECKSFSRGHLYEFKQAGHYAYIEDPLATSAAIKHFLNHCF